jgi:nicotinate-nucleotide adenylyltransferase
VGTPPPIAPRFDALIAQADAEAPLKLGILGGTFDPVHLGHLHIAEQAYAQYGLTGVLFIPTGRPAWKLDRPISSAEDRIAMLSAALSDNPHFDLCRLEIDRPGVTYTIDTLRTLKAYWADAVELYFIVGADAAHELSEWRDASAIATLVTILAARRPGVLSEQSDGGLPFDLRPIDTVPLDISSSELRTLAAAGRSLRYVVPEPVRSYIREHGLYGEVAHEVVGEAADGAVREAIR